MKQQDITTISDTQGVYHQVSAKCLLEAAASYINKHFERGPAITQVSDAKQYLHTLLAPKESEVFFALWLDSQHHIVDYGELFNGTIDGASIYPREVVKRALKANAAAVIFAHNHPSGSTEPSKADIDITHRLRNALELIDVRILDHVVVGNGCTSMAERGLL